MPRDGTGEVLAGWETAAAGGRTMIVGRDGMAFTGEVADKVSFMEQGQVWERGPASMLSAPATPELRQFLGSGL
ncbi:hypothetical protein [Achromobacter ruhlandii]|uniref:hypothetical protein n=1 Tax=Achromobacter ruhlandii TaxID=72557 RepID=UPI002016571D|nr:hypothetical protein [Achromobacter ruhlandii]